MHLHFLVSPSAPPLLPPLPVFLPLPLPRIVSPSLPTSSFPALLVFPLSAPRGKAPVGAALAAGAALAQQHGEGDEDDEDDEDDDDDDDEDDDDDDMEGDDDDEMGPEDLAAEIQKLRETRAQVPGLLRIVSRGTAALYRHMCTLHIMSMSPQPIWEAMHERLRLGRNCRQVVDLSMLAVTQAECCREHAMRMLQ